MTAPPRSGDTSGTVRTTAPRAARPAGSGRVAATASRGPPQRDLHRRPAAVPTPLPLRSRCRCSTQAHCHCCRYHCRFQAPASRWPRALPFQVLAIAARAAAAASPLSCRDHGPESVGAERLHLLPGPDRIGQQHRLLALVVDPTGDQQDGVVDPDACRLLERLGEDDHLGRTLEVLERRDAHGRLALGDDPPEPRDDAAQHDPLLVELLGHVRRPGVDVATHLRREVTQGMIGQVQTQQLLLPARPFAGRRLGGRTQRPLEAAAVVAQLVEQRALARDPVALLRLAVADGIVEPDEDLGRMSERREGADLGQRLEHPLVDQPQVDARAQVGERPERTAALPRRDDGLDGALADVLDGQQPEPDGLPFDREMEAAAVDIRRQHRDADAPALGDRARHPLGVVAEGGEHAGHVLDRVVRLEIRGLVGDQPVAGGVGLVEAVALEGLEGLEHRVDDGRVHAPLRGLGHELALLRAQDIRLLLADGVAQGVRLGTREAAQRDGGGHDVLLVDEDAVRLLHERLQQRVEVGHGLLAVLPPDVRRDVVHRPGPEERHHRREVVDRRRPQLPDIATHARGLQLEHARRLARGQQLERLRVIERDVVDVDALAAPLLEDEVDRLAQDGQVRQAQEVELEQAERLDAVHLVLGHQRVGVGRLLERHQLRQRLPADDDARGVGGCVARDTLHLLRKVEQLVDRGVVGVHLLERLALERLLQLDAQLVGHRLGDPVDLAVAHAQDAADIPDRGARQHRAEGDDLGDMVRAVLAGDVGDDLVPPAVLEVHVDIRHRDAVGVEEALEGQLVVDGVDRRDAQGVGHDRPGGAASAGGRDALLACEADEVGHDQEVACVAHADDDAQLVVEPRLDGVGDGPVALVETPLALLAQPLLHRVAIGHREVRQPKRVEVEAQVDHLGDAPGVADRLRLVGEQGRHLGRRLEVEVVGLEAHPVGLLDHRAGADAQQRVMGLALLPVDVVEVVGRDQRQAHLGAEAEQLLVEPVLVGDLVVLELEEEAVRAQDVRVRARDTPRGLPVVHLQRAGDLAVEARGQADQPRAVLGEVVAVDARLVVVAVDVGIGHDAAQVLVAGPVLGQQDQVVGLGVLAALPVGHRPPRDVRLDADDGLDAPLLAGLVERDGAIERAVVGDGQRIEAQPGRLRGQVVDAAETVEEAELRVDMEVGEVVRSDRHGTVW